MRPFAGPDGGSRSVLLAALLAAACGGDGGQADPGAAEAPPPSASEAPVLAADSSPRLRTYHLLLVNPGPIQTLVYADAGAERILLDTVPRADSVRVNVEVRAARLRLTATDRWGERLAAASIDLRPDSLHRWELPGGTPPAEDGGRPPP